VRERTLALEKELAERKRIEEQLRQSEERFLQLIDTSSDAIYIIYNQKFEIINKKFRELFGVTLESVNHHDFDFSQLVTSRSKALVDERVRRIQKGEGISSRYEFTAISKDGTEVEIEASVSSILYKDGIATLGLLRDIAERKALEKQIRQSQKIQAISTLAGGIAHDFNNILTIIRGYTELSLEETTHNSNLQRNLHYVLSAADRARELVNQILTFSRQREEVLQPVKITHIVHEALRIVRPTFSSNIEIHEDIEPDAGIVMADPSEIRQILMNLCTNALHAMRNNGGELRIILKKVYLQLDDILECSPLEPGPYIKLSVSDTGHGMEPYIKERIFEPFFTTKSAGEGVGMGLPVIHGLIRNYGGDITVHSNPGHGTVFDLFLPVAELPVHKTEKVTEPHNGHKERILYVEDDKILLFMQQEIFEHLGYDVVAISNPFEALDIFAADPEIFHLVITDQVMPGMTGIQLSRELLRIRADIPIILCTGFSETVTRKEALKIGIKEFIMKPIITREVAGLIHKVLNKCQRVGDSPTP